MKDPSLADIFKITIKQDAYTMAPSILSVPLSLKTQVVSTSGGFAVRCPGTEMDGSHPMHEVRKRECFPCIEGSMEDVMRTRVREGFKRDPMGLRGAQFEGGYLKYFYGLHHHSIRTPQNH